MTNDIITTPFLVNTTPTKQKNLTELWFSKHLRPKPGHQESDLMLFLRRAIITKCAVSASAGLVDDHIQSFFLKAIRLDSFGKKLAAGENVTYSHVATYAIRSAWNEIRNDGTEPLCRELFGARTETERKKGHTPLVELSGASVVARLDDDGFLDQLDVVDGNDAYHRYDVAESFNKVWGKIEELFSKAGQEHYLKILELKALGFTHAEIADEFQCTQIVVGRVIKEVRDALLEFEHQDNQETITIS